MKKIMALSFVLLLASGCSDEKKPNIELIQDMMKTRMIKAQEGDESKPNGRTLLRPPKGTKPIGFNEYTLSDSVTAEQQLRNPYPVSKDSLALGAEVYNIRCAVCHGMTGAGDGPVAEPMLLKPPSLISDKIKKWRDGGLYHLVVKGRGMMSGYGSVIRSEEERWAVVNYVRHLQKNAK